jgi:RNA polymerase sigma-70 factor (ECF subfamily)
MQQRQRRATAALDDSPIARLYQQHALSIMTYVRRHVPLHEDAEDIVLEVFLAALEQKGLAQLSEPEQLAWLRRVAHHKFVDYHRRSARRPAVPFEETDETLLTDEDAGPDHLAVRREEDMLLRERLTQLPEHYQTILQLRFVNGLRCTEIAKRLNKSDGAIRMLLSRALNILRDIYAKS